MHASPHGAVRRCQRQLEDKVSGLLHQRVRCLRPYARATDLVRLLWSTALQSQRQARQTGHVLVLDILVGSSSERPHNWEVKDGEHGYGA